MKVMVQLELETKTSLVSIGDVKRCSGACQDSWVSLGPSALMYYGWGLGTIHEHLSWGTRHPRCLPRLIWATQIFNLIQTQFCWPFPPSWSKYNPPHLTPALCPIIFIADSFATSHVSFYIMHLLFSSYIFCFSSFLFLSPLPEHVAAILSAFFPLLLLSHVRTENIEGYTLLEKKR